MIHQDWEPCIINKSKPINKKITVQNNLDEIDEIEKKDNISLDNRLIIQQARLANKLTQKQLAQKINKDAKTIQNYESGNIVPDYNIMCNLEKILKVKLNKKKKQ